MPGRSGAGDGEYLSVRLHGLQVFTCREEAVLGTGHVVRQGPSWGCEDEIQSKLKYIFVCTKK